MGCESGIEGPSWGLTMELGMWGAVDVGRVSVDEDAVLAGVVMSLLWVVVN